MVVLYSYKNTCVDFCIANDNMVFAIFDGCVDGVCIVLYCIYGFSDNFIQPDDGPINNDRNM
jgi:hypothetical protein